ncbi:ANTAR domain-containing protein [Actinosynnema sp. ALI-1.44]|uniref:ANTAR domain-containing protein n=1 Tax=Actinosynnema sp. ALI-1.44 TaxID=1933779 RepID=UPI0022A9D6C8|nr:ANTAR domain-containing protein [Actinosynnema sp. ALI-1.44]
MASAQQRQTEHRDMIGIAEGILMHRHDIGPVAAFRLLVERLRRRVTRGHVSSHSRS